MSISLLLLPPTPYASQSLIMSHETKTELLKSVSQPRIILVGGSNVSFGINSKMIKDILRYNPINTAIHANIGLKFMCDNTLKYVKKGDVVVLLPEYTHYVSDLDKGSEELLRILLDADISSIEHINMEQFINMVPFLPRYIMSKINPLEYLNVRKPSIYYTVDAFNEFGDTNTHWGLGQEKIKPKNAISKEINNDVFDYIKKFERNVEMKGGVLLVGFPSYQSASFENSVITIEEIEKRLHMFGFNIIGNPERYKFKDNMMFNTTYHLNKDGVDRRTKILIEDISNMINW